MKKSIHRKTYEIFSNNPDIIFNTRDIARILRNKYEKPIGKNIITTILTRLYRQNLVLRIPTQLSDGYYYSLRNKSGLDKIYENHLIPYSFRKKQQLIEKIIRATHTPLRINDDLDMKILLCQDFARNYPYKTFDSASTICFLSSLVGFIMCDGHICQKLNRVQFFFRRKNDAISFIDKFKKIFIQESLNLSKNTVGNSYRVQICKGSKFARFLHYLGAPKGNKTKQAFMVPDWIYHGNDQLKTAFLSTVIGNEGSAPSNRKWRIQFVLSKSKEYLPNLIDLLNQIRAMLYHFGITTSHIQLRKQPNRQFHGRFYIKGKENLHKFYKQLEFSYASEKQEVLEELIGTRPLRSGMCNDLVNTR